MVRAEPARVVIAPLHLMAVTGASTACLPIDPVHPTVVAVFAPLVPSEEAIAAAVASIALVVEAVFTAVVEVASTVAATGSPFCRQRYQSEAA
jgi:hypothetical protein